LNLTTSSARKARNMTAEDRAGAANMRDVVDQAELDKFGVARVPADLFLWGGYRYSNARDALAAAKRAAKP
jgi:hypothetical protein